MTQDIDLCLKYNSKFHNAKQRGIEFNLPFQSFKNLMRAKKCFYTGATLTQSGKGLATDLTIDRKDSKLGYIKGNCVAACYAANNFKSLFEGSNYLVSPKSAKKILKFVG
jgi:hypothetical protein